MRRLLIILISVCAVIAARADDVITINSVNDLVAVRNAVNQQSDNDTYAGKTVKLMTDLDLDDSWVPIGIDDNHSFQGTFDGQGYIITINVTKSSLVLGLFGYVGSSGVVQNLRVAGRIANTETVYTTYTGGIAGKNHGTIRQCANLANIIGYCVGGIAGENHGTITNCYNQGYIGGGNGSYLGGIVGNQPEGTISYCYASCKIEDVGTKGGIFANKNGTVSNCYYDVKLVNVSNQNESQLNGSTTLTGSSLVGNLNTQEDKTIWTFTDGQLPELNRLKSYYTVQFYKNDNNITGAMLDQYFTVGVTKPLSNNTFDGKIFTGWATEANGNVVYANQERVTNLTGANTTKTLYAKWTDTYTVIFNKNAEDATGTMADQSLTYGGNTQLTPNAFTRTGYTFAGWNTLAAPTDESPGTRYVDQQFVQNITDVNHGTITLYAQWTPHTYTVKFNANGGSGTMSDMSFTYGEAQNLTANAFTPPTGKIFVGWSKTQNGNVEYTDGQYVKNLTNTLGAEVTLYALWKREITITAKDASKTYDGSALTEGDFTITGLDSGDSHTFIVTMTAASTITNAGTRPNVIATVNGVAVTTGLATVVEDYWVTVEDGTLEVTQKAVTITAHDASKTYDGSALTKNSYTNTALATGDQIESVTVTGSQTVVGTSNNVPSAAVIKNAGNEDVTASYDITYANGTLEVTQKAVTITADGDTKVYDGTALTKNSYTNTDLATGDAIESVTVTGSQTVVGTSNNVPSAAVIKNGTTDMTANYNITYTNGTLEVTQKALTITAESDTKVYDGTPLTKSTYTNTGLASSDAIESVTVTGSQTVVGTNNNVPSAAVIKNGSGENVTASYDITYANGTLTIDPASVTLTANSGTETYDGTHKTVEGFTSSVTGLTFSNVSASGSGTNTGSYDVTFSGVTINTTKDDTGNYVVTGTTNGTLTIDKAVTVDGGLTIEWDENGKVAIFSGSTTDADAVSITTPITDVTAVTLNRDFSNGKYATLILPFTMTNDMTLTGAKLYQFVGVEKKNGQWIATMQTPTSPLQANTPYLVDPVTTDLTGGKLTFNLNGEKVMLQTDDSNNGSTNSNWQFKGTYSRLIYGTAPLTDYVYGFASKDKEVNGVDVKAGEFVYAKEGAAVPPLRCYLTYKNGEQFNGARTMTRGEVDEDVPQSIIVRLLGADGEPTNVVSMDIQTGEISTDGWYSMDGVKLQGKPTKKGLYIHNGKKEIVK